ncbi:uncharacterized protein LY79DRAFT_675427 [Colletotrichum navitas]|uniref:Uncharacterized protein n=1 Tax=Colletotrichum navitas TaxID=681940 RepID=A0AAD8PIT2_9PEZI|nr:uncharacterized protein LY79DRAFT_675427 [Colletotrichum navitas]KAK1561611.1 hypothetical protein LY79DRAFT_675427 [Colletotrichum navitas]
MEGTLSAELQDKREFDASLAASLGELRDVSSRLCDVQEWFDQARTIRRELLRWRGRKNKADIACLVTRSGVARAAKVVQAVREDMVRSQEQWNDPQALRGHVAAWARQADEQRWRRWEEQTAYLGILYPRSLRDSHGVFA